MARHSRFKISKDKVREYILENILDEETLQAKPWMSFWNSLEFQVATGMKGELGEDGKRKPCSRGTIAYWIRELKVYEEDIYNYHVKITKKIDPEKITLDAWSKKKNKGQNKEDAILDYVEMVNRNKRKFMRVLNKLADKIDYCGVRAFEPITRTDLLSLNECIELEYSMLKLNYKKEFESRWS